MTDKAKKKWRKRWPSLQAYQERSYFSSSSSSTKSQVRSESPCLLAFIEKKSVSLFCCSSMCLVLLLLLQSKVCNYHCKWDERLMHRERIHTWQLVQCFLHHYAAMWAPIWGRPSDWILGAIIGERILQPNCQKFSGHDVLAQTTD